MRQHKHNSSGSTSGGGATAAAAASGDAPQQQQISSSFVPCIKATQQVAAAGSVVQAASSAAAALGVSVCCCAIKAPHAAGVCNVWCFLFYTHEQQQQQLQQYVRYKLSQSSATLSTNLSQSTHSNRSLTQLLPVWMSCPVMSYLVLSCHAGVMVQGLTPLQQ